MKTSLKLAAAAAMSVYASCVDRAGAAAGPRGMVGVPRGSGTQRLIAGSPTRTGSPRRGRSGGAAVRAHHCDAWTQIVQPPRPSA